MVQDKRVCHLKIINQNNKPNKEKTMKKMTVVLGVFGFALVSLAGELTVTGTGVVKRQPDKMKITFTVSAEDKDMTVARRMFEEHTATLASAFVAAGILTNEVVTSGVSMCVDYDWHEGRKFNGYMFEEDYIFVAKVDRARLNRINSALFSCKAVKSLSNSFELFDPAAARNEARTLAVKNARDVAQRMARDAGVTLCEINEIIYTGFEARDYTYTNHATPSSAYDGSGSVTSLRDIVVSETVCIKWKIK